MEAHVDTSEARAHLNYLLTLGLRREEAFGPMALNFIKEEGFENGGLLPEEQFSLIMATVQALAEEPKRYNIKLDMLKRAAGLLEKTSFHDHFAGIELIRIRETRPLLV